MLCDCAQQGVDGSQGSVPREIGSGSLMATDGLIVQYALDTREVGESRRVEALRVKQMSLAQECPLHVEMLLETIVKRAAYFGTRVRCTATAFLLLLTHRNGLSAGPIVTMITSRRAYDRSQRYQ
jgi:hypothetical protein